MVGVGGASRADQTRLRSDEFEVGLVAQPTRFADRKDALADLAGSGIGLDRCRSCRAIIDHRLRGDLRGSQWFGDRLDLFRASPWPLDGVGWCRERLRQDWA